MTEPVDDGLFWQQPSPDGDWVLVIEEDAKVCYGYLYELHPAEAGANRIKSDVWLYNRLPAPEVPEWSLPDGRDRLPFVNSARFVVGDGTRSTPQADQIEVKWSGKPAGVIADIYLDREHFARLKPGSKPGWSKLASHRNAIAIPLAEIAGDKATFP